MNRLFSRPVSFVFLAGCFVFLETIAFAGDEIFSAQQIEFFEKKIRPILVENCHECHGAETQEASLRLDSRQSAIKGGDSGPAIVPGDLTTGELVTAIEYDPDGYQMPPDGKLPQETIDLLKQWVKLGAPWSADAVVLTEAANTFDLEERAEHWSFQPLKQTAVPDVHDPWCRGDLDRFVYDKLAQNKLRPAQETDRRTWIRRAYLDVIGLPPSPEEVNRFLSDQREQAFDRVVDHLLESPHIGERWGRHWLDVVRYAESRGHEFDHNVANAWQYRDYVIRAINEDVPFDQFVVEHIAGDLLTSQTSHPLRIHPQTGGNESILGTGFWFLGEWSHSPVDIRQEEADRFDNMIDVYSKAFLGLTVACARCHDHKFDPIRQADFYAIQGFLQSSSYQQARFETAPKNERIAVQLREIDRKSSDVLRTSIKEISASMLNQFDSYLLCARELIQSGQLEPQEVSAANETVLEDFESGIYRGWTPTGDAFGKAPQTQQTIKRSQGDVRAEGKFFVNSHQSRDGGRGDKHVGKLTSPEFEIQQRFLRFLIGGGNDPERTCVRLIVNGSAVRSACGRNSNQMLPIEWDLKDFHGERGQIEIVDQARSGWGNIGADHFVFSDRSTKSSPDSADPHLVIDQSRLDQLAQKNKLDAELLLRWANQLTGPPASDETMRLLQAFCSDPNSMLTVIQRNSQVSFLEDFTGDSLVFRANDLSATNPGFRLIDGREQPFLWTTSDLQSPVQIHFGPPIMQWDPRWNRLEEAPGNHREPGAMEKWERNGKILRSPDFEINTKKVFCLVRGNVNSYAAVDSHVLVRGPLHGVLTQSNVSANREWRWISHDLTDYIGHNAHVELIPEDADGFAVRAIVLADEVPQVDQLRDTGSKLAGRIAENVSALPGSSAQVIAAALNNHPAGVQRGEIRPETLNFVVTHPQLFGLTSKASQQLIAERMESLDHAQQELLSKIERISATAPCLFDGTGLDEYIFIRGSWKKRGETVPRRFLEVFGGEPIDVSGSGRMILAEQMVNPQQTPILPRVIVNRIWQHYFGRGICPTPNDFGHLGQLPTHPELLDWLAVKLLDENWSLKSIHRLILLSSAYRMSSRISADPRVTEVDPQNFLLHRMNVKRLEGEAIRDTMLAVSGELDETMYGSSIPIHLTDFLEGRGRPTESGPIDGDGRRSIYIAVRRNFPDPFFTAFDLPTPHSSFGRRNVSNVPAQALALMNNPMVTRQAEAWAQRLLRETPGASTESRIVQLFEEAFSRPPTEGEQLAGKKFLERTDVNESESIELWTDYCHVLFNFKELIFVK